jgi:hypothetical protein
MNAIILIPFFFSAWIIARRSAAAAFLDVWLPCLMLLPAYFYFRPKHLPPLLFTDMAALPIMVAIAALYLKKWRWCVMDVLVLLFVALTFVSETRHTGLAVGGLELFGTLTSCLFPYLAGRIFMEQPGVRSKVFQRYVLLLCVVTVLSVWDFVGGTSMFQRFWQPFFSGEVSGWPIQLRWGFGRIAGPYGQAILCGMMYLIGILLATGMRHFAPEWGTRRLFPGVPVTVRAVVITLLVLGLLMTQSRGPVFGALVGFVIVQIARAYDTRRASIVVGLVVAVSLVVGYKYIQEYTAGDLSSATTLEQQNAIYRAHLYEAYEKIMKQGGMLGWGESDYPKAVGLDSIDNEYLFLAVTHGYLGLTLFVLMSLGTVGTVARMLPFATEPRDKWLLFTLISIFVGLLFTITTVFLAAQVFQMYFLLVGWIQALRSPRLAQLQAERRNPAPAIPVYT